MSEEKQKPAKKSASFTLEGEAGKSFDAVKAHMQSALPGINPTNAEVARYAVNLAAQHVATKHHG